jgi:hypothetical protein
MAKHLFAIMDENIPFRGCFMLHRHNIGPEVLHFRGFTSMVIVPKSGEIEALFR